MSTMVLSVFLFIVMFLEILHRRAVLTIKHGQHKICDDTYLYIYFPNLSPLLLSLVGG